MNPWAIISIIAGSVAAFLSAASFIFGRAPAWQDLRRYAAVAACVALYTISDLGWSFPPSSPRLVLVLNQVGMAASSWFIAAWLWYGGVFDNRPLHRWERPVMVMYLVFGALSIVPSLSFRDTITVHEVEMLGLKFSDVDLTPYGTAVYFINAIGGLGITIRFYRRWLNGDERARVHATGMTAITLAGFHDATVASGNLNSVYLLSTGFLTAALLSARYVASRVVAYGHELVELSSRLERTVQERTAELAGAQVKLGRAEKMMALGQLAGGVAHEINNPAAVIRGNISYLQDELKESPGQLPPDADAVFDDVLSAVDRIAHIVRSLSDAGKVANRAEARTDVFRVDRALEAAVSLARPVLGSGKVNVASVSDADLVASGQSELFAQVVANLVRNAAQAIDDSGVGGRIELKAMRRGNRLALTVTDDGPGLPEEIHSRVFEPFFTTRQVGSGSGLGLAVSAGLMRAQGGTIELAESRPGCTIFTVELPLGDDEAMPSTPPRGTAASGLLRLLIIDDEPALLAALKRLLRGRYEVETAGGVSEALERLKQHEPVLDAVLCDISMPEGGGERVYAELMQWAPEIAQRTLFLTGGAVSEQSRDFIDSHQSQVMLKPLDVARLGQMLERLPKPPKAKPGSLDRSA